MNIDLSSLTKEEILSILNDSLEYQKKLQDRINKVLEILDKPYYYNLRIGTLKDIQEILKGSDKE